MSKTGKVVASIEARMGSTRLPGKTLRPILGKPMLERMIERVRQARSIDGVVVATSDRPQDAPVADLAARSGVSCFRGSEDDVLARVLGAADSVGADHIVELWGDTPLIDPQIIDDAIVLYRRSAADCVATCLDKTFPWGMSLLVFSTATLREVDSLTDDPVDRENVSNYIYEHPDRYRTIHLECPEEIRRPDVRLTVDQEEDFQLVSAVFAGLAERKNCFNTRDILKFLDEHPELTALNREVRQKSLR